MSPSGLFAAGLSTTFLISIGVVRYLSSPLRKQLLELCGNADRAEFWTVFSNTTLALVPTVFAMQVGTFPKAGVPPVFAVVGHAPRDDAAKPEIPPPDTSAGGDMDDKIPF